MSDSKQIIAMRAGGKILHTILASLVGIVRPGQTGIELNAFAEARIASARAVPAFKHYHGFPAALCVSNNDEVVHGIPNAKKLKKDDVLSLDLGIQYQGYFTDCATTVIVTDDGAETIEDILKKRDDTLKLHELLLKVTWQSLQAGIAAAIAGAHTGDIGYAVQTVAEAHKFGVVRDLVGHGVGTAVHQKPNVPNFGKAGSGEMLTNGLTIAIEPMITLDDWHVICDADGWTIRTEDGSVAAHFEHTVLVGDNGAEVLT